MSVIFAPVSQYGFGWKLSKLGYQVDPTNVAENGSQYQHGKSSKASWNNWETEPFWLDSVVYVECTPDLLYFSAVDNNGVYFYNPAMGEGLQILSPDVPLALVITETRPPSPFPFPLKPIQEKITGMAFNIYNNIWNTNFIYFYPYNNEDRNFKARFVMKHLYNM